MTSERSPSHAGPCWLEHHSNAHTFSRRRIVRQSRGVWHQHVPASAALTGEVSFDADVVSGIRPDTMATSAETPQRGRLRPPFSFSAGGVMMVMGMTHGLSYEGRPLPMAWPRDTSKALRARAAGYTALSRWAFGPAVMTVPVACWAECPIPAACCGCRRSPSGEVAALSRCGHQPAPEFVPALVVDLGAGDAFIAVTGSKPSRQGSGSRRSTHGYGRSREVE